MPFYSETILVSTDNYINVIQRDIMIMGPEGTLYEGGFFKARLSFPQEYPLMPPVMKFSSQIWHPNVYEDGTVCISILHPPGSCPFAFFVVRCGYKNNMRLTSISLAKNAMI